ncbi:UDP-glycosyltransferase 86A1-like [Andrographis paniculata]|uniref:Glycosyltransferase n=1 Tax=Andrographis paniculata TaxID=175694 RepID=A0A8E3MB50_ANDPA|nr:UDP-glycosyltransferase 86A1-like [Andrographis paniculata]QDA11331.1 UDP-glycosyltransferase [Andrographis paniculata]
MENNNKVAITPNVLMIAIPYQGHLNPFLHLAIKLASKGFAIHFVHTLHAHHVIKSSSENRFDGDDVFSGARESGLDIRYSTISDGFPIEYDRSEDVVSYWDHMLKVFPSLVDEFVANLINTVPPSPWIIVADTISSWQGLIAEKYNMVNVSFWTEPAVVFALDYYVDLLTKNGHFPSSSSSGDRDCVIDYIPGVAPIHKKDLMSNLQESDSTSILNKILLKTFEEVKKADIVLHNTVEELESYTLSTLNELWPTYAIGPINFSPETTKLDISKSLLPETDCTEWLNSKPPGSVLYVSFGSLVQIEQKVIQEVARGLRASKLNFLWALRRDIFEHEINVFPAGFEDDVKDRGLIITWCDQIAVMSNPAVGGFLTHCGWNSILESMWFGVPMICYPVLYDQPTNRKLVVDDWKIGIDLCQDKAKVEGEEVAWKIKTLMNSETSDGVRNEMKKLTSVIRSAWGADGSSTTNFNRFLDDLNDKIQQKYS